MPGVTIISRPGSDATINFRGRGNLGTSSPLYVIDGAIADAEFFSSLDPSTIESISFLKDAASSAIYGSRAAYGVVLVKTKGSKKGDMKVTYNGYMIPQSSSRRLTYADVAGLSSWQLTIARNEIYARHGRMFDDPDIRAFFEAQPWYYGYILPGDFDASVLSATEQYNIGFIKSYE